jgi:transposase
MGSQVASNSPVSSRSSGLIEPFLLRSLGLLLQVLVSAANVSEKAEAKLLLEKVEGQFPRLQKIFADGGDDGNEIIATIKEDYQLDWEVVKRKPEKGFKVLPWRWIVERTLALVSPLSSVNY